MCFFNIVTDGSNVKLVIQSN
uniref:Uncharacterized protein n=1 Tax=Arundo donax TaxID=35708 RepID=A0A0A8Y795_ARUDO